MDIIRCSCGYYKQMNDELCPNCKADYSTGASYEVLDDQKTAQARFKQLGEKGFNDYMKSIAAPVYMICPKCGFKMLTLEAHCPKCNLAVKYKPNQRQVNKSLTDRVVLPFFGTIAKGILWANFLGIMLLVVAAILWWLGVIG